MRLSRSEFKSIIAEAIERVQVLDGHGGGLTIKQRKALLKVGDTATRAGSNYCSLPPCPAGQAFGYPPNEVGSSGGPPTDYIPAVYSRPVVAFAYAYDDLLRERVSESRSSLIEVEDAPGA